MKAKEIQELLDFIAKSGLDEVNVETDSFKVSVKRNSYVGGFEPIALKPTQSSQSTPIFQAQPTTTENTASIETTQAITAKTNADANLLTIKSPMIGTFYRTPNPDAPNFVNIGDDIKEGQIVCIIEAMKLFNEIESDFGGRIVKILVENATPVEYDQPLFLVEQK